ncbi:MAG: DNA-binding protein [Prevotella sp.]|nr:DNA-binding protein [Prevotella sp.]
MKRINVILPVLLLALSAQGQDTTRPWTFWYWMYGAVSKAGIKADLQAMKDVGLGGCYLMPIRGVEEKPEFEGKAQQLTPEFWTMVDYAFAQADSLGLELGIHICDGFALAGGPWIAPEESMQHVVWSDTIVDVGKGGAVALPQPAVTSGYYEDIASFAVPVWCDIIAPHISGTIPLDDNGTFRSKEPGYIQFDYDEQQTVRSLTVVPSGNNVQAQRLLVQASDDGITYRDIRQLVPPRQGWQNTDADYTYALPETTSRHFRFCWTPEGTEPGSEDMDAAKWSPVLKLKKLTLSAEPRIDQWENKNGSVWRIAVDTVPANFFDAFEPVRLKVEDGKVRFPGVVSAGGKIRVLRFGHTTTGHQNATAGGGKGLECDKFSAAAVKKQIAHWFGEFKKRPHAEVVKYMHVDSWECGSQNWSRNFAEEFQRRRGYDLLPYMPVYAGYPMKDCDRVLRDIRLTINDLLQDGFFATVARQAKAYGVRLSCESVAPTMVSDGMQHYRHADVPMGEFWLNSPTHDKPNDMLDAISGAHVYGKPIVQAEGFTEVRGVWDETPASLKRLLDRNFALGMNRLFFHVFTHNPWLDRRPGMTLDGIGLFFQRDQTWFAEARGLVDYATRCQQWLQRGWPVVDIAVFTGEEMPRRALTPDKLVPLLPGLFGAERVASEQRRQANAGCPMEESPVGVRHNANILDLKDWVNPLHGYNYDSMNPDALLAYAANEGHQPRYRALVVADPAALSDTVRQAVSLLQRQGIAIIDKPFREARLDGVAPDVQVPADVAFCHRRDGQCDIYFLSNQSDAENDFTAVFRTTGSVMVYDPLTDRYTSPIDDIHVHDSLTAVRLNMQPGQALFVLFNEKEGITPHVVSKWHAQIAPDSPKPVFEWRQKGGWLLHFRENGRQLKSQALLSWTASDDPAIRYFSGHVRYTTTIRYKGKNVSQNIVLDLGDVRDVAHVWLNGRDMGLLWTSPYKLDVTGWLQQGNNKLEVEVVNTWHNALRGADKNTPPYGGIWTNARYRTKGEELLPAGLLGPVELKLE